nr:hypothetical protein Iba_chr03bCG13210 [Ipomoea batatas]
MYSGIVPLMEQFLRTNVSIFFMPSKSGNSMLPPLKPEICLVSMFFNRDIF